MHVFFSFPADSKKGCGCVCSGIILLLSWCGFMDLPAFLVSYAAFMLVGLNSALNGCFEMKGNCTQRIFVSFIWTKFENRTNSCLRFLELHCTGG